MLSVVERTDLYQAVERVLAGICGAATSHALMKRHWGVISRQDTRALTQAYAEMLAKLRLSPNEIQERIDFQQERERLLTEQFTELQVKVDERDLEIKERKKAEVALQEANEQLEARVEERTRDIRTILDNVTFGFLIVDRGLTVQPGFTSSCRDILEVDAIAGQHLLDLLGMDNEDERLEFEMGIEQAFDEWIPAEIALDQMTQRFELSKEKVLRVEGRVVRDDDGAIAVILMTISDITELERAQRESVQNRTLISILRQKQAFKDFLLHTRS